MPLEPQHYWPTTAAMPQPATEVKEEEPDRVGRKIDSPFQIIKTGSNLAFEPKFYKPENGDSGPKAMMTQAEWEEAANRSLNEN